MSKPSQCMYLNTLVRLVQGGLRPVTLPLASPVTFSVIQGEVRELPDALPDRYVLILPLTHDTPSVEAIAVLADRVGGTLNGKKVEIGVRDITVTGDEVHIPFFALPGEGEWGVGKVSPVELKVEIV